MHKFRIILALLLIVGLTTGIAIAKEEILNVEIADMVESTDRNGNQYIRFIANFDRKTKGQTYTVGLPIMAFGATVEQARAYQIGDTLKCVAQYRKYQERESYTILAFVK